MKLPSQTPATTPSGRPSGVPPRGGFILITTLLLLASLTLLALALYSTATNDTIQARNFADTQRAELSVLAGFEAAKALLLEVVATDDYFVVAGKDNDPQTQRSTPYHFVSRLTAEGRVRHVPLWAGGMVQETGIGEQPTWNRDTRLNPTHGIIAGYREVSVNVLPGRATLQPVYGGWLDGIILPGDPQMRYTYWIEDMEGLPQLDVIGVGGNGPPDAGPKDQNDAPQLAAIRLGYSRYDSRVGAFTSTGRFRAGPEFGNGFPLTLGPSGAGGGGPGGPGQRLVDCIAPGLSPKEYHIPAGTFPGPLAARGKAAANLGTLLTSGGAGSLNESFVGTVSLGLRPYLRTPQIPNLGYGATGPKLNLNALLEEGPEAIAEVLRQRLPEWADRGGAFPDDYLLALAANIIDYADEDNLPTSGGAVVEANDDEEPVENYPVRGFESYPVVNECYLRFEWTKAEMNGDSTVTINLTVTPIVEFWNQTNQAFPEAQLDFIYAEEELVIATKYQCELGADLHLIDLASTDAILSPDLEADGSIVLSQDVALAANEFRVVEFPAVTYEWEDLSLQSGEERPEEFTLQGPDDAESDVQGTYKIEWDGVVIDWAPGGIYREEADFRWAGAGSSPPAKVRFRGGNAGHTYLANSGQGVPDIDSPIFNPGDPRISYYIRDHSQRGDDYGLASSLGSRNSNTEGDETDVDSMVDPEQWPDGGYQTDVVEAPGSERVDPETGNPLAENYIILAPNEITDEITDDTSSAGEGSVYNARAPYRLSNLGRYFSLSELGNVYDPIMYPSNQERGDWEQWRSLESGDDTPETGPASDASAQGGGNTLRIGRPEHPALAKAPAAVLLDLFHVGVNGTNLELGGSQPFNPNRHVYPPSPRDADSAEDSDSSQIYRGSLHAESPFELVRGRLNVNTASVGSLRMLLGGALAMDEGYGDEVGQDKRHPIHSLATEIYKNRPYVSLSQLASVFHRFPPLFRENASQNPEAEAAIDGPRYAASDAVHEEAFARCLNLGQLSSRHFRIIVAADYLPRGALKKGGDRLPRFSAVQRVYEVFLRPIHDLETGELQEVRCEVLSVRDR